MYDITNLYLQAHPYHRNYMVHLNGDPVESRRWHARSDSVALTTSSEEVEVEFSDFWKLIG